MALTGTELKAKVTSILDGEEIDDDLFLVLANTSKTRREQERPWRMLLKENSSNSRL